MNGVDWEHAKDSVQKGNGGDDQPDEMEYIGKFMITENKRVDRRDGGLRGKRRRGAGNSGSAKGTEGEAAAKTTVDVWEGHAAARDYQGNRSWNGQRERGRTREDQRKYNAENGGKNSKGFKGWADTAEDSESVFTSGASRGGIWYS